MPVARIVAGIGKVLITAGLLLLLFVAYQLWGTGLAEARAQDDLRDEFAAALATTTTSAPTSSTTTTAAVTSTTTAPDGTATSAPATSTPVTTAPAAPPPTAAPRVPPGSAVAIIRIPRIGLDKAVVEGVTVGDLEKGPGHYPSTPLPGRPGNAAIAGHRTTYGAPFGELGELDEGDEILVTTREGEFRYLVDGVRVVSPRQVEVLDPSEEARITLTTCHPRYSARQRLVVTGVLAGPAATPEAPPAPPTPEPDPGVAAPSDGVDGSQDTLPADGDGPGTTAAAPEPEVPAAARPDAIDDPSLAGDPAARVPAASWAAVTAAVALVAWAVGRRWRPWPSYLLALPFGAVALFRCFEQVARLLPANI